MKDRRMIKNAKPLGTVSMHKVGGILQNKIKLLNCLNVLNKNGNSLNGYIRCLTTKNTNHIRDV